MKHSGQIVLFKFPQTDLAEGKLRPALLLGELPKQYGDCLICMISSQMRHFVEEFDEIVQPGDADFVSSGLKSPSLIRVGRLAVVGGSTLLGAIGEIDAERLHRLKRHLANWLTKT